MTRAYLVVVLFLAIAVSPLSAQRHGGGGGGHVGMHGGGGGGHVGMRGPSGSFGGHAGFSAGRGFAGRGFAGRGFPRPGFSGHGFAGRGFPGHGFPRRGFVGHGFAGRGFFNRHRSFFGFPGFFAYPFFGYPYYGYYDTLGYSSYDSSYDAAAYSQNQQLSQQLYDLSSQVRDLREQNDQLRYDLDRRAYRGNAQPQPEATPQSQQVSPSTREVPSTILAFQDGRRIEARSYAIVGQTLWILSPKHAQKFSLAQLNLDETKKLNAERGVEFDLPTNN